MCSDVAWPPAAGARVADAMVRAPKVCGPDTTVADLRRLFAVDAHVHAALIVSGTVLVAVVERADLEAHPDNAPALRAGTLDGRAVAPDAPLASVHDAMLRAGRRRLAVIDPSGALLGLLCLKRTGLGFCSDADVQTRALERRSSGGDVPLPTSGTG